MKIKRLNGKYGKIVREFETTKDIIITNKYKVDLLKIDNGEVVYYYLSKHYFTKNLMLYMIEYDESNEDYYSTYICEFFPNEKNIFSKAKEKIKRYLEL